MDPATTWIVHKFPCGTVFRSRPTNAARAAAMSDRMEAAVNALGSSGIWMLIVRLFGKREKVHEVWGDRLVAFHQFCGKRYLVIVD